MVLAAATKEKKESAMVLQMEYAKLMKDVDAKIAMENILLAITVCNECTLFYLIYI
jgi:hypothetical protein